MPMTDIHIDEVGVDDYTGLSKMAALDGEEWLAGYSSTHSQDTIFSP
jgi:hypothetical protein